MWRMVAILGIILMVIGTWMVFTVTEIKGKAAVHGPSRGTPEEAICKARQRRYQYIANGGFLLILLGAICQVPLVITSGRP